MVERKLGDANLSFEQAFLELISVQSRGFDSQHKPDIEGVKKWVLKQGPRSSKVAVYWSIRDRNNGQLHHHELKLATIKKVKKQNSWIEEEEHSITLNDEKDGNEIGRLLEGLASVNQLAGEGQYVVINPHNQDDTRLRQILDAIASSGRKIDLLAEILSWANDDPQTTADLIRLASEKPTRSKSLAAALNYARYSKALVEFENLVAEDALESVYQSFLEENIWIFGSEYSELLSKRTLTVGTQLDFPLIRTVDGYLEAVEIKRPLNGKQLFREDKSHPGTYIRNLKEIGDAIDQAANYLTLIEADRYRLENNGLRVEKARAKVIIGRDYGHSDQILALRRLNEHNNRVEVITYDQLIKIGRRILEILSDEAAISQENNIPPHEEFASPPDKLGDIPF